MKDKWQIRNKFILLYTLIIVLASASMLALMFFYARSKNVIVTEEKEETTASATSEPVQEIVHFKWDMNCESTEGDGILIVCPGVVSENNLSVSVRYDVKRVQIEIKGFSAFDFKDRQPVGDFSLISTGTCEADSDRALFTFKTNEVCECEVSAEGDSVVVRFVPFNKDERPVVIIDAGHGGTSAGTKAGNLLEKDVTLKIAKAVERKAAGKGYRVMLTRSGDETVSTVERLNICQALTADAYVGIHLSQDIEAPEKYGMSSSYNSLYYDRDITNAEFAGCILKNTCIAANNKAHGVEKASDEDVFLEAMGIPATVLYAGYMTNPDELKLLGKDEYVEMIADGIVSGLDEIYGGR